MLAIDLGSLLVLGIKSWGQALGVKLRSWVPIGLGYQAVFGVNLESWVLSGLGCRVQMSGGLGYRACKLFNIHLYATLCFNYFR